VVLIGVHPVEKDSVYKPIERQARTFGKTMVSKKLQEALPFKSKPKQQQSAKIGKQTYMQRRAVVWILRIKKNALPFKC
jgi:ribosome biogenesis protein BMS1